MLATCDKSRTCNVDVCNRKHSVWLHVNQVRSYTQYNVSGDEGGRSLNVVTGSVNSCMTGNRVYLPLVTVLEMVMSRQWHYWIQGVLIHSLPKD